MKIFRLVNNPDQLWNYWKESYTSGVSAEVWIEVDSIPAGPGIADVYLYYGNAAAASVANLSWTIAGSTIETTDNSPLQNHYILFQTWADEGRLDDVYVRKYANPEPAWGV